MLTFSVITPTLNRGYCIADAVRSVEAQDVPVLEHIVVDGGSTDETLGVLDNFSHLTIISEPDHGIYDALNKGLRRARGDIVVWLNSDDQLMPKAFKAASAMFDAKPDIEMVCGKVKLQNLDDPGDKIMLGTTSMQDLNPRQLISGLTLTNSRFIRREVFDKIGFYDITYPIASDRDFLGRCFLAGVTVEAIPEILYQYGQHDASLTFNGKIANASLIDEYCRLSMDRYRSVKSPDAQKFYGRWAAWALFYRMVRFPIRSGAAAKYWRFSRKNPDTIMQLIDQIFWHILWRKERRGRKL